LSFEPGTLFAGDYRVVKPLNQGGMGAVYVVQQISTGKHRALKLMHSSLVYDPPSRAKFEQEARIGARIASEHVVEVVAAGVDPQTQIPFLVMELLEGEDLATRLKRGPLGAGEATLVLEQIAHALGAAHDAGVIHRDLKPENIFLGISKRSTAGLVVKLLDFGIAKVTEDNQRSNTTGAYGTPMWLAPEQTRRGEITPAADVWAFGLVTFMMLTGHPFWRSAEGRNASLPRLIQDITQEPIPPASSRAREYAMGLPNGYDAWLARALERDPRMRFPNARVAWQALAPILSARPTPAVVEAVPAPAKSSGALIAFVVVLALLALATIGGVVALFMMRGSKEIPVAATTTTQTAPPPATTSNEIVAATAPIATVSPPPLPDDESRIGFFLTPGNDAINVEMGRRLNGALSHELDKCLDRVARGGTRTAEIHVIVSVARDGTASVQQLANRNPGPVAQCLVDTLGRQKFNATSKAGQSILTLMWKHP
jgi:tRNA A-37 threonylcarbamoyl transferase component Bud32